MDKINISYVTCTVSEPTDLKYLNLFFAVIIENQVIETQLALRWNIQKIYTQTHMLKHSA